MTAKVSARGVARHQKAEEKKLLASKAKDARAAAKKAGVTVATNDSFQNYSLNLGQGTNNALSSSTYGFNPITRVRTELEWIHRGSWLGGVGVDIPADDMTREGVDILADMTPDDKEAIEELAEDTDVWGQLNAACKWADLYGGAIVVPLLDGHDLSTPLDPTRVGKGMFKGLLVLDRWSVEPSLEDLVTQPGPDLGKPRFYTVTSDAPGFRQQKIHYTRAYRIIGIELPYWQAVMENLWGISIFERLYDRMVAFDSASTGAAQLVFRAWIRTLKMKNLREAVATGGDMLKGIVKSVEMMRMYQSIEGISLIDDKDTLEYGGSATSFSGIGEAMLQFAQQLSGALQVPLVRMFGQSPGGLNANGESDLRMYYDGIGKRQKKKLKRPVTAIYEMMARSLGINVTGGIRVKFRPLWQLDDKGKAEVGKAKTETILGVYDSAVIDRATALKELRALAQETGLFTNITDEMIEEAELDPPIPQPGEVAEQQQENMEAAQANGGGASPVQSGKANVKSTGSTAGLNSTKDSAIGLAIRPRLVDFQGIPLFIETFAGQERRGVSDVGPWRAVLAADYGYFEGTKSAEGPLEQMDVFIGLNPLAETAFVIDQVNPATQAFDEHKVMLGFNTMSDALRSYLASYSDRAIERVGAIKPMTLDEVKTWMHTADVNKPVTKKEMAMP